MANRNQDVGSWDLFRTWALVLAQRFKKADCTGRGALMKMGSAIMMPAVCVAFVLGCWLVGILGAVGLDSGYSAGFWAMSKWKDERGAKEMMEVASCDASTLYAVVGGMSLAGCWTDSAGRQFIVAHERRSIGCEAGVCRLRYARGSGSIEFVELEGKRWKPAPIGRVSL